MEMNTSPKMYAIMLQCYFWCTLNSVADTVEHGRDGRKRESDREKKNIANRSFISRRKYTDNDDDAGDNHGTTQTVHTRYGDKRVLCLGE